MKIKHLLLTICFVLLLGISLSYAQAPQQFNYQGAARNANGTPLVNRPISLRISILDGSSSGTVQYAETRSVTTNQLGLYNIIIGSTGAITTSGSISTVTWATGLKYIKVEVDPNNGSAFSVAGTAQLLSVPYALYAATGGSASGNTIISGNAAPTATIGANGDYYIDNVTNIIYGPKANGTWPAGKSLVGPQGIQGVAGAQGVTGAAGRGINGVVVNADGTLTVTYTDGTSITTTGNLKGPKGDIGATGAAGKGIVSTVNNNNGTYTFTYTDGSTFTTANLTGPAGAAGASGAAGKGIVSTVNNNNGTYTFTYTDGSTFTTANLTGPAGAAGASGAAGKGIVSTVNNNNGTYTFTYTDGSTFTTANLTGPTGPAGANGTNGTNGKDGKGIVSTVNNNNGTYTFTYTDGSTFTTANLTGPAGANGTNGTNGTNGQDGKGIASTVNNNNGTYTFTYTDGSTFTTANLTGPAGANGLNGADGADGATGAPGKGIASATNNSNGSVTFTYTDGTTFTTIATTNVLSKSGTSLTSTVNGVASTIDLQSIINAGTTNTLTATNGNLVSTVNGVANTPAVPVLISAGNGLTATNGDVKLGGTLTEPTTITTDATNTLKLAGLQAGSTNDKIVTADANGVLKTVDQSTLTVEPFNVSSSTTKATSNTQNIYQNANVGIGDFSATNPIAKLDVRGAVRSGTPNAAELNGTSAIGLNSVAMGTDNKASGDHSIAMGWQSTASFDRAIAIGAANTASGLGALALGWSSTSSGTASTGLGWSTSAQGEGSLATNYWTNTKGFGSTAMGVSTIAPSFAETVLGKYNAIRTTGTIDITSPDTDPLLQIGNGTGSLANGVTTGNNALTILKNAHTAIGVDGTEALAKPTELLDLGGAATAGNGGLRIRNINTAAYAGSTSDKIVTADANGVLKTVDRSTFDADLRLVGTSNHITKDAGLGANGTSAGTGSGNVAIGKGTLLSNTSGSNNIGIGSEGVLELNKTGVDNIAFGNNSLLSNEAGSGNVAVGESTLANSIGSLNVGLGTQVLINLNSGNSNLGIGHYAGNPLQQGSSNILIGSNAGNNLQSGSGNLFLGNSTGYSSATTASNQLFIGNTVGDNALIRGDFSTKILTINNTLKVADLASTATATTGNRPVVADANGQLKIGAAVTTSTSAIVTVNTTYTVLATDRTIIADATAAGFTITLPSAAANTGRELVIRKADETTNVLTFDQNLKYSVSTNITTVNSLSTLHIQSDGNSWWVISKGL